MTVADKFTRRQQHILNATKAIRSLTNKVDSQVRLLQSETDTGAFDIRLYVEPDHQIDYSARPDHMLSRAVHIYRSEIGQPTTRPADHEIYVSLRLKAHIANHAIIDFDYRFPGQSAWLGCSHDGLAFDTLVENILALGVADRAIQGRSYAPPPPAVLASKF